MTDLIARLQSIDPALLIMMGGMLVLCLIALAAVIMLSRRGEAERQATQSALSEDLEMLARQQNELAGRLSAMADQNATAQSQLAATMNARLDQVSHRLGQSMETTAQKTAESLGALGERLTAIDAAQKNITELSHQVVGLQDILSNRQARGAFGEVQLKDIVSAALPPSAYDFQVTLANRTRADCLVHLPNPPGPIVIDAKFPLEGYHALRNAEDDTARKQGERQFRTDLQKHIKDIAERYIISGETAESALMFLPSEAVYAELHANFTDLVESSYRARVWIVSPTTLMATLNTVRAVLRDVQMREQAHLIKREVDLLLDDLGRLQDRTGKLGTHFGQVQEDLRQVGISTDKLTRRGERIRDLELGEEEGAAQIARPFAGGSASG